MAEIRGKFIHKRLPYPAIHLRHNVAPPVLENFTALKRGEIAVVNGKVVPLKKKRVVVMKPFI